MQLPLADRHAPSQRRWRYRPPDWVPLCVRPTASLEWDREYTEFYLEPGEVFDVSQHVWGDNGVLFLRLADGRGWVFDRKPYVGILCIPYDEADAAVFLCTYKLQLPCSWALGCVKCMCVQDADAYHVGVSVYGREWAFYGGADGTGVRYLRPGAWSPSLLQQVTLGRTELTEVQVNEVIQSLEDEWPSSGYSVLSRNCCHFAREFCQRLTVGPLPDSVLRLDVYATREVVNVVKDGKEALGRPRTNTFHYKDFCCGLAAYGKKHRLRRSCCPRAGCFSYMFQPCDSIRGVYHFFRRLHLDKTPRTRRSLSTDGAEEGIMNFGSLGTAR